MYPGGLQDPKILQTLHKYPTISIVTPSFNQGQYIEQTILSVIGQSYPNLEYIIIDGGSTDDTVSIIKKYEAHLSYWISEPDKGQSDALNKGLARCTGEIFNWINSDDYLEKGALFTIAERFAEHPGVDMVCGWCRLFDEHNIAAPLQHRTQIFASVEETMVEQRINQPASFYRLSVVKKLGGINPQLQYVMDLDLWFRYLAANGQKQMLLIDAVLAHFRMHGGSKTVQMQEKFRNEEKKLWFHLLEQMKLDSRIVDFFKSDVLSYPFSPWDCSALDRQKLTNNICKKYLLPFYLKKNIPAARFAFINQLKLGNIGMRRDFAGIFFNLFIRRRNRYAPGLAPK